MWRALVRVPLAALLATILASAFRLDWAPWWMSTLIVLFAAFSAWRPLDGLIAFAAAMPVAGWVGAHWNYSVAWPEALVIAFALGWTLHGMRKPTVTVPLPSVLRAGVALFTAIVIASALVDLAMLQLRLDTAALSRTLWDYVHRDYFVSGPAFRSLQAAALLLEGLLLFDVTAGGASADPRFAPRVVRALAAGMAVAAAINVQRLLEAAMRTGDMWTNLARYLATVRLNVHFGDTNAAGSQFAMLLFVAIGLALARTQRARLWILAAAALACGLWISGSRAALLCGVAGAAVVLLARRSRPARRTMVALSVAVVLVVAAVVGVAYLPMRGNQRAIEAAVASRMGLIMTGLRMARERPVFGIGLGEFYQRSGEFSSPELLRLFPPAAHENAHNYFVQVLAELGGLGLASFLLVIGAALTGAFAAVRGHPRDPLALTLLGGLVTFLFTCLGGHPLLVREPAYAFWLLLGIAARGRVAVIPAESAGPAAAPAGQSPRNRLIALAAVAVFATIPFRARSEMREADLEHLGIGVSVWQGSDDGVRFRWADEQATIFVPGRGPGFVLRLRSADIPARVELRLDGRLANVVNVDTARWTEVRVLLPAGKGQPRFSRLDVRTVPAAKLMISRVDEL